MRLLLFVLLLSTGSLFAQRPDSLKTKKWAVGLTYSPDYCYRFGYTGKTGAFSINSEKGKAGFTAGVNLLYKLMDKVGIEFGILYSTKGQKVITPAWTTPGGSSYDPSIPNYYESITQPEKHLNYTYKYLEIPLKINVSLINNRFKVFPSIGCSANIFMGKTTTITYDGGKETLNTYDAKNIPGAEFAVLAGIGLSYDISKNLFVKCEPAFRSFIRPLVDGPISGTFYSIGANTGIYLRF